MTQEEWYQMRCGYLTASVAEDVCKRLKTGGKPKSYEDRLDSVLAERLTGEPIVTPPSQAMMWGKEHEAEAAEAYEIETGLSLLGNGEEFYPHPTIKWLGASPDRLIVNSDGLVEIKCPNTLTHLERLRTHVIPDMYKRQMQVQLLCTGRKWVDFVDYDPRFSGPYMHLSLLILRYEPKEEELKETERLCCEFLADVEDKMKEIESMRK